MLETIWTQPLVQALGWALVHFVWQGALISLLLACALLLMRKSSASARYAAATSGLVLMLAAPLFTFTYLYRSLPDGALSPGQATEVYANGRARDAKASLPQGAPAEQAESGATLSRPASFASFERLGESRFAPLARWLAIFWLCGTALLSLRLFRGWMTTERLRRKGIQRVSERFEETFARLAESLGVSRPVRLYKSALVEVPTVIGWLRPVVLVPVGAFAGLSGPQLEALLAHELAHVRRYDYLVNLLQSIAETLLFYHPAVWWVSSEIRIEREHACDDLAVEACGDALLYARALAELESLRTSDVQGLALAATGGGSLILRVRRLISRPEREQQRQPAWLAGLVILSLLSGSILVTQAAFFKAASTNGLNADPLPSKRQVAVTFVALPLHRGNEESIETLNEVHAKLLRGMAANNIKAVGFVGEGMLYVEGQTEARINLLRRWLDAGHELGNQTYKHMSLYKTPLEEYKANVIRGEQVTRALLKERGMELRYFSYPFLNTGPNLETKRAFEQFLAERGYTIHAVTIDNMDWIFSNAYQQATRRQDAEAIKRISDEYVAYMESVFAHYERLSTKVFGREISQVLMLSVSALNADNMERLIEMLKRRGYSFVTLEEALRDPAFSQPNNAVGPWGISWIERWAMDKGVDLRGDPLLPKYMHQFGKDGLKEPDKPQSE